MNLNSLMHVLSAPKIGVRFACRRQIKKRQISGRKLPSIPGKMFVQISNILLRKDSHILILKAKKGNYYDEWVNVELK